MHPFIFSLRLSSSLLVFLSLFSPFVYISSGLFLLLPVFFYSPFLPSIIPLFFSHSLPSFVLFFVLFSCILSLSTFPSFIPSSHLLFFFLSLPSFILAPYLFPPFSPLVYPLGSGFVQLVRCVESTVMEFLQHSSV